MLTRSGKPHNADAHIHPRRIALPARGLFGVIRLGARGNSTPAQWLPPSCQGWMARNTPPRVPLLRVATRPASRRPVSRQEGSITGAKISACGNMSARDSTTRSAPPRRTNQKCSLATRKDALMADGSSTSLMDPVAIIRYLPATQDHGRPHVNRSDAPHHLRCATDSFLKP